VQDVDTTYSNAFSDEVEVVRDMLHTLMLNGVGGEVDGADVIIVDESALSQWSMEFQEELPKPTSFGRTIYHGAILNLGARAGDDVLAFGGPGDEVVAEEHIIARGALMCIWATHPVRIRVDRQLRGGGEASQVEGEVQGASQIAQDALYHSEVRLLGIMHMEADLLNCVGDVGAGERHVLEGPDEAHELSWISNKRPESSGDLGLRVHGR
jgi:hypothetical protein